MKKTTFSIFVLVTVIGTVFLAAPNAIGKVISDKKGLGVFNLDEKKITEALHQLGKNAPVESVRKAADDFQKSRGALGKAYKDVLSSFQKIELNPEKKSWEDWKKGMDTKYFYAAEKGDGNLYKTVLGESLPPELFFKINIHNKVYKARKEFEKKGVALKVAISSAPPEYKSAAFQCLTDYEICLKSDFNIAVCLGYLTLCAADTILP